MLLVEMNDNFGVRLGAESMALLDQFLAQQFVVVDLTIESDADLPVFVVERLVALLEVDNAQADMAEDEGPTVEQGIARAVRPAVADRRTHQRDVLALGRAAILFQDHINAAHEVRRALSRAPINQKTLIRLRVDSDH